MGEEDEMDHRCDDHDHTHDHDHDHAHPHEGAHGHTHDAWEHAGRFEERDAPLARDFGARAFTVGIGGPVGSGKTALLLALCRAIGCRSAW
jgi:urease accessory protein